MNETEQIKQRLENLENIINGLSYSDRFIFQRNVQFNEERNIMLGHTTGTQIGTEPTQKLAFLGATPVVQQTSISAPAGGLTIDTQARTAINSIRAVLTAFGLTA